MIATQAVLAEVVETGPATARQLAEGTGIPESTVRAALDDLEKHGLVEWEDYQQRARRWMATEKGEEANA